jgi:pimeloyl-ACP methyl ester carboxylesterase
MPYAAFSDLDMYYEALGVGEALIFLHSGYSRGILAFSCQMLDFQQSFTCYFPDFRGHGRTRCERLDWDTPRLAQDLLGFMDCLGLERVHLIGYSLGAGVGLYAAVQFPRRIVTLVTIGGSGFADPAGADDYEPEALLRSGQTAVIQHMLANHQEAHRGDWQEFMRQSARDWRLYPQLTEDQLRGIRTPALFIAGEKDPFASRDKLEYLSGLVPGSQILIVPGGSHRPHMLRESPQLVNEAMLAFLRAHPFQSGGDALAVAE